MPRNVLFSIKFGIILHEKKNKRDVFQFTAVYKKEPRLELGIVDNDNTQCRISHPSIHIAIQRSIHPSLDCLVTGRTSLDNDDSLIGRMMPMIMIRIVLYRTITKKRSKTENESTTSSSLRLVSIIKQKRFFSHTPNHPNWRRSKIVGETDLLCTIYYVSGAWDNVVVGGTDQG